MQAVVLYRERYCLFVGEAHELAKADTVTWFDAAQLPLCSRPTCRTAGLSTGLFFRPTPSPRPLPTNSIMISFASVRTHGTGQRQCDIPRMHWDRWKG